MKNKWQRMSKCCLIGLLFGNLILMISEILMILGPCILLWRIGKTQKCSEHHDVFFIYHGAFIRPVDPGWIFP